MSTLTFPAPGPVISANARVHWRTKAAQTKLWRSAVGMYARGGDPVDPAHVVVTIFYPDRRKRDVGNLQPTAKAIVDGLVDAGVLPNGDDDDHLLGPDLRRGRRDRRPTDLAGVLKTWVQVEVLPMPYPPPGGAA